MNINYKIAFFITLVLLFIAVMAITGLSVYSFSGTMSETQIENNLSVLDEKVSADNLYENTDFRFRFELEDGEQALTCPNVNEYNNNMSVEIIKGLYEIDSPEFACAKEGPPEYIFASKKIYDTTYQENLKSVLKDYNFISEPYTISGIKGFRYVGTILPDLAAPIPSSIDFVVVEKNGIYYQITADFYNRNVSIY